MKSFTILILFISTIIIGCYSCNSGPSKSSAKHLSKSDFSQFGNDPWSGELPIRKGDFIALNIDVTTQGTKKVVYTQYEYIYTAKDCYTETQRRTFVDFSDFQSEKFREYVGKNVTVYGIVDRMDIKRPEHACDEAHVFVTLSNMEIESH